MQKNTVLYHVGAKPLLKFCQMVHLLTDLYCSPNIFWVIKSKRMRLAGHVACMGDTGIWWGNLRKRDHLEDTGVDGKIILRWIFRKWDVGVWTGPSWLNIGTVGGHLRMQKWTFGFHKMRGICWLVKNRLTSQEGLCCIQYGVVRILHLEGVTKSYKIEWCSWMQLINISQTNYSNEHFQTS